MTLYRGGWKPDLEEHVAATVVVDESYRSTHFARFGASVKEPELPKNFYDLLKFSTILDQVDTSACVGFTVAGSTHCRLRALGYDPEPFSPIWPYTIGRRMELGPRAPLVDEGSYPWYVINGVIRYGLPVATKWPFGNDYKKRLNADPPMDVFQQASQFRISQFARFKESPGARLDAVRRAIFHMHPVPLGMLVGDSFQDYRPGRDPVGVETKNVAGHMTYLVGWEDDGEVLIGNTSWGTSYGDHGFYRITRDKLEYVSTSDLYNLIITENRAPA